MSVALVVHNDDGARLRCSCHTLMPCEVLPEVLIGDITRAQRQLLLEVRLQRALRPYR